MNRVPPPSQPRSFGTTPPPPPPSGGDGVFRAAPPPASPVNVIALTGMVTAVGSVLGTFSTVFLAWRADRRTAKESDLKLVQLQQQIKELELKLKAQPDNPH